MVSLLILTLNVLLLKLKRQPLGSSVAVMGLWAYDTRKKSYLIFVFEPLKKDLKRRLANYACVSAHISLHRIKYEMTSSNRSSRAPSHDDHFMADENQPRPEATGIQVGAFTSCFLRAFFRD